jgi:hypothetical protein
MKYLGGGGSSSCSCCMGFLCVCVCGCICWSFFFSHYKFLQHIATQRYNLFIRPFAKKTILNKINASTRNVHRCLINYVN